MPNTEEKDENHNVIKSTYRPIAIYSNFLHAIFDVFLCFPSSSLELQINKIDTCREKHKTYQNVMIILLCESCMICVGNREEEGESKYMPH